MSQQPQFHNRSKTSIISGSVDKNKAILDEPNIISINKDVDSDLERNSLGFEEKENERMEE